MHASSRIIPLVLLPLLLPSSQAFLPLTTPVTSSVSSLAASRSLPLKARTASSCRRSVVVPVMSSAVKIPITISGNNVELTPALKQYINEKLTNTLSKVGRLVTRCDAHLTVDKNPSVENNANFEVVVSVKGTVMRASKSTHDMYASIDAVADSVKRKLRKYKERIIDAHRQGKPEAMGFDEEEIQGFKDFTQEVAKMENSLPVPPADMSLMKKKTFPMEPISVEDAVLCLDYIEHDFYVFKNKENGKIAVVYKRNHGGVGLIEPQ